MCRECYFSSIILLPSPPERRQAGKGRQQKAPESLKGELSGAGFIGWVGFLLFFGHFLLVLGNELVLKVGNFRNTTATEEFLFNGIGGEFSL